MRQHDHSQSSLSVVHCTWRLKGKRWQSNNDNTSVVADLMLVAPPALPIPARAQLRETTPEEKMRNLGITGSGSERKDPVGHQKNVGEAGSKRKSRASNLQALALGGSSVSEGLTEQLMPLVYGLCFHAVSDHTMRMISDERWCAAFRTSAIRASRQLSLGRARVCVLGMGCCVPAMAAAQAGAQVLWVERVERFAECARRLAKRNAVQLQVVRRKQWELFTLDRGQQLFDVVITEEIGDDLLEEGILLIARHAQTHLLPSLGVDSPSRGVRFIPARATSYGCLVSLRVRCAAFECCDTDVTCSLANTPCAAPTTGERNQRFRLTSVQCIPQQRVGVHRPGTSPRDGLLWEAASQVGRRE